MTAAAVREPGEATCKPWRSIIDGPNSVEYNMALDHVLFQRLRANSSASTLRIYRFSGPAVTLGRHQFRSIEALESACSRAGIALVRRLTGGRAILHGTDIVVSICTTTEAIGLASSVRICEIYLRLSTLYITALAQLGVAAVNGACSHSVQSIDTVDCFQSTSRADVIEKATGRKLLGSALYRADRFILQQTSIPLVLQRDNGKPNEEIGLIFDAGKRSASVFTAAEDAYPLDACMLEAALMRAARDRIGVVLTPDSPHAQERHEANALTSTQYASITVSK